MATPHLRKPRRAEEQRPVERLFQHYLIEKEISDRLRNATRAQRLELYSRAYDELFQRVADHPQITRKSTADTRRLEGRVNMLRPFLNKNTRFLEIGAGDCALSFQIAPLVKEVHAVDVSMTISQREWKPENFEFHLIDGIDFATADQSIDLAFSDQLMEHLHPDDACEQLANIHRTLANGGRYVCITPSRLSGPHDVSYYFADAAEGLHLKEYGYLDLVPMMRQVGFRGVYGLIGPSGWNLLVPGIALGWFERLVMFSPTAMRHRIMNSGVGRTLLGVAVCATK